LTAESAKIADIHWQFCSYARTQRHYGPWQPRHLL